MIIRILAAIAAAALGTSASFAAPAYRQVATIALGAPDRWDYVVADPPGGRVYVAKPDGGPDWGVRAGLTFLFPEK